MAARRTIAEAKGNRRSQDKRHYDAAPEQFHSILPDATSAPPTGEVCEPANQHVVEHAQSPHQVELLVDHPDTGSV